MPTIVTCHNCGQRFQAEDFLAGKRVGCPQCGNPLQIPVLDAVSDFAPPSSLPTPASEARTVRISPQTQQQGSGVSSPLISQSTGKVIGTLAGGGPARGGIAILIAPSRTILDAMNRATAPLPLQTVVGR